nr:hypothetical protein CFP56_04516 [Quercus suber]
MNEVHLASDTSASEMHKACIADQADRWVAQVAAAKRAAAHSVACFRGRAGLSATVPDLSVPAADRRLCGRSGRALASMSVPSCPDRPPGANSHRAQTRAIVPGYADSGFRLADPSLDVPVHP